MKEIMGTLSVVANKCPDSSNAKSLKMDKRFLLLYALGWNVINIYFGLICLYKNIIAYFML